MSAGRIFDVFVVLSWREVCLGFCLGGRSVWGFVLVLLGSVLGVCFLFVITLIYTLCKAFLKLQAQVLLYTLFDFFVSSPQACNRFFLRLCVCWYGRSAKMKWLYRLKVYYLFARFSRICWSSLLCSLLGRLIVCRFEHAGT